MDTTRDVRRNVHLRTLLAETGEGFLVLGEDRSIRILNETAERLLGVDRTAVHGTPVAALGIKALDRAVDKVLGGKSVQPVVLDRDGFVLACRFVPFQASAEVPGGIAVIIRDDTELVAQQERAEAILAGAGDGMVVFAPDSRITYVNPAGCELLGLDRSKVVGTHASLQQLLGLEIPSIENVRPCWEIRGCGRIDCPQFGAEDLRCWLKCGTPGPSGGPVSFRDKRERCITCDAYVENSESLGDLGGTAVQEITLTEPEHRVLEIRTNPVVDRVGKYLGCVSTLHDVTAAREIAIMKNEFVSMVSHELRTPLTSIKGYVDLIVDGEAGEINEIQREFLSIVQENSDRLVSLINDLLDISRIESGRVHLKVEPLEMDEIVRGVAETFRTFATNSGVDLNWHVARGVPRAAGDRDRVGQVLMNFVSNAIKYSPGGGSARIDVRHRKGFVLIEVTDTGIGIAPEDQEKLFGKFYRVDSSLTREIGGTGLGLSICKSVVELLGGQVGVRSKEGEGSTFWFTLPVAQADLVRTPEVEGPLTKGGRVLVVDSSPEIAQLIGTFLVGRGFEVVMAVSAREAFDVALETQPSVITLDVMLEGLDGFDLLQRLKDDERTSKIPVLVLSVVCDEGKSLRLGAADYLEKPIDQTRLAEIVGSLVGQVESPVALVVDDDRNIVDALARVLRRRGFAVMPAYDGREAMAAIAQRRPDLVLLDLKMPVMDGYQVIQEIKRAEETRDIPIVVMTAHRIDHDRIDLLNLASEQLSKPFSPEQLADKVEAMLDKGVG